MERILFRNQSPADVIVILIICGTRKKNFSRRTASDLLAVARGRAGFVREVIDVGKYSRHIFPKAKLSSESVGKIEMRRGRFLISLERAADVSQLSLSPLLKDRPALRERAKRCRRKYPRDKLKSCRGAKVNSSVFLFLLPSTAESSERRNNETAEARNLSSGYKVKLMARIYRRARRWKHAEEGVLPI